MKFSIKNIFFIMSVFFISSICSAEGYSSTNEEISALKTLIKYDNLSLADKKIVNKNIETMKQMIDRHEILQERFHELEIIIKSRYEKYENDVENNHDAKIFEDNPLYVSFDRAIKEQFYYRKQIDELDKILSAVKESPEKMLDTRLNLGWNEFNKEYPIGVLDSNKNQNLSDDEENNSDNEEFSPELSPRNSLESTVRDSYRIPKLDFSRLAKNSLTPRIDEPAGSSEVSSNGQTPEQFASEGAVKFWQSKFNQASSRKPIPEGLKTSREQSYRLDVPIVNLPASSLFGQTPRVARSLANLDRNKQFRSVAVQTGQKAEIVPLTARLRNAANNFGSQTARGARSVLDTARQTTESLYEKSRKALIGEQAFNREQLLRPRNLDESFDNHFGK